MSFFDLSSYFKENSQLAGIFFHFSPEKGGMGW